MRTKIRLILLVFTVSMLLILPVNSTARAAGFLRAARMNQYKPAEWKPSRFSSVGLNITPPPALPLKGRREGSEREGPTLPVGKGRRGFVGFGVFGGKKVPPNTPSYFFSPFLWKGGHGTTVPRDGPNGATAVYSGLTISSPGPLILNDQQTEYPLGTHIEILEDPGGVLTIDQVVSEPFQVRFLPSQVEVPNYGFTTSVYWVRMALENGSQRNEEWLLEIGFANTHYVDLYEPSPDGEYSITKTGSLRPVSTRDVVYPHIVFDLSIPSQSRQTYYLRFESEASMTLPMTLWNKDAFWTQAQPKLMLQWLFFGSILALLVYQLVLLFFIKETSDLFFALLLASLFAFVAAYQGYLGVYLIPQLYMMKSFILVALSALFVSIILFSDTFLELKTRNHELHLGHMGFAASWAGFILFVPFVSYHTLSMWMAPWALVTLTLICVVGVIRWKNGFHPDRIFMIAWLGMLAGLFLAMLVRMGTAPSTAITENIYQPGMLLMAAGWSVGLAKRINLLKAQTKKATHELQVSEHRMSQILDSMPFGVVVYGQDQKPIYLNKRTVEILSDPARGIQPDINAGRTLDQSIQLFSFEDPNTNEIFSLQNFPVYRALQGTPAAMENIRVKTGEKQVSLEMWASPVRDEAGNVESAVAAFQEITRRKEAEMELAEYRKQLETLIENRTAELNAANKELRLRLEWLAAVNLVNQTAARSADSRLIFGKILEIVNHLFEPKDSFIAELDSREKQIKILAHSCRSELHPDLIGSMTPLPKSVLSDPNLNQGKLVFLSKEQIDTLSGPVCLHVKTSELQSIALVPLQLRDQVIGFLGLELHEESRAITNEESILLSIFSTDITQIMENARLFEQAKMLIATEERNRLARDLHDSVTQVLFSATLVAEVLPQTWARDPERAMQSLEKLRRLTRGALAEMRTMLLELRPSAVVRTPLGELLTQLTEAITSRSGLPFQLFIEKIPILPEEVQMNFYHIAQEALNNVVKHSQAKHVIVNLSKTLLPSDKPDEPEYEIRLIIQDDGVGFFSGGSQTGRLGISIMRERAAAIQAVFSLESEPGYGALVTLIWSRNRV